MSRIESGGMQPYELSTGWLYRSPQRGAGSGRARQAVALETAVQPCRWCCGVPKPSTPSRYWRRAARAACATGAAWPPIRKRWRLQPAAGEAAAAA